MLRPIPRHLMWQNAALVRPALGALMPVVGGSLWSRSSDVAGFAGSCSLCRAAFRDPVPGEAMLPPDCRRLSPPCGRPPVRSHGVRQVGDVLGIVVGVRSRLEPLWGKPGGPCRVA